MIDTYLKSKNLQALEDLRSSVMNMIGPSKGQAATDKSDVEGEVIPAQPAKGDTTYWYACVRAPFPVPAYGDIETCNTQEGDDVCGVWS